VGEGLGEADGDGEGEAEGWALAVGETVAEGEGVADAVADGVAEGVAETVGLALCVGEGEAVREGEGDGLAVGVGVAVGLGLGVGSAQMGTPVTTARNSAVSRLPSPLPAGDWATSAPPSALAKTPSATWAVEPMRLLRKAPSRSEPLRRLTKSELSAKAAVVSNHEL
jgi:hypothetical protein